MIVQPCRPKPLGAAFGGEAVGRTTAGIDDGLKRVFDWLSGLSQGEAAELRDSIMDTVMLKPGTLLLSSIGILMMSGAAAVIADAVWAWVWFLFDLVLLALRLLPTIRYRGNVPPHVCRRIISTAAIVFTLFGLGCAASMSVDSLALRLVATSSLMAVVAGVATRWAALPRLAVGTIFAASLPFVAVLATSPFPHAGFAALQFATVAFGTGLLTLQNHRTLVAMLRAERQARLLAATDPLTKLGNRTALELNLSTLAEGSDYAVLFIDLDRFKAVNDNHGHLVGDRLLAEVAERLRKAAMPYPAYRIGGDEFVVLVTDTRDSPEWLADHFLLQIGRPFTGLVDGSLSVGASIGVACGLVGRDDVSALLNRADRDLYKAKRRGGGRLEDASPGDASPQATAPTTVQAEG